MNFLGKLRMEMKKKKLFPLRKKKIITFETVSLTWKWSEYQFIKPQLNKLLEIKPFKFGALQ